MWMFEDPRQDPAWNPKAPLRHKRLRQGRRNEGLAEKLLWCGNRLAACVEAKGKGRNRG